MEESHRPAIDANEEDSEDDGERTSGLRPMSRSCCSEAVPTDSIKKGDATVNDSDSELCTGQSFGVRDEGYISMIQVETEEQKLQKCKDESKESDNHLVVLDEKEVLDCLKEEQHKKLKEQRKIWEEELRMKLQQEKRILIMQEEFKLDQERRRLSALVDAKLEEERKNLIAKRKVQMIDLKRKYGLSDKQKHEVDKILKELDKMITKREKKYQKEVDKIKKNNNLDKKQRLQFEADKKLYKINKVKRECNEKLAKREQMWTKEWIVRVESLQSRNSSQAVPSSYENSNTSMQQPSSHNNSNTSMQ